MLVQKEMGCCTDPCETANAYATNSVETDDNGIPLFANKKKKIEEKRCHPPIQMPVHTMANKYTMASVDRSVGRTRYTQHIFISHVASFIIYINIYLCISNVYIQPRMFCVAVYVQLQITMSLYVCMCVHVCVNVKYVRHTFINCEGMTANQFQINEDRIIFFISLSDLVPLRKHDLTSFMQCICYFYSIFLGCLGCLKDVLVLPGTEQVWKKKTSYITFANEINIKLLSFCIFFRILFSITVCSVYDVSIYQL